MEQTGSLEINPFIYDQLTTTKEARLYNRKDSLFNKWCWENRTATCKKMKLEHSLNV